MNVAIPPCLPSSDNGAARDQPSMPMPPEQLPQNTPSSYARCFRWYTPCFLVSSRYFLSFLVFKLILRLALRCRIKHFKPATLNSFILIFIIIYMFLPHLLAFSSSYLIIFTYSWIILKHILGRYMFIYIFFRYLHVLTFFFSHIRTFIYYNLPTFLSFIGYYVIILSSFCLRIFLYLIYCNVLVLVSCFMILFCGP